MIMLRIVEFFAGTGNFAKGFSDYGKTVFANDFDRFVERTYNANHDLPMTFGNVWDILDKIPEHDILLAGFPCQSFSVANFNRKGMGDESRGNLFFAIVEALKRQKPNYFVLENVPGIFSANGGKDYRVILELIDSIDYHMHVIVLSPHTHANIPQARKRVFFVGFAKKSDYEKFSTPSPMPLTNTFRDFLESDVPIQYFYKKNGVLYPKIKDVVVRDDRAYHYFSSKSAKEIKSGLIPTLTASMGSSGNAVPIIIDVPKHQSNDSEISCIRKLTPRECASFQGMSDDYVFPVSDTQSYKMIGNAVNVAVIKRIADAIFGN